ncbi:MAG: GAF domain-containing protein [Rhodocyclaceae bacterium]|nr:GAF domain-containing protein [Rhodocyclaceae bacterium]
MQAPAIPADEADRVETLRQLLVLDTPAEDRFDNITSYAQSQFGAPIVLVSLVDTNRQWFKSSCGLDASQTSREISFCGHAILHDDIFEIPNALNDERFANNPLVTGAPKIRFYAGAPLTMSNGQRVGTLCLISPAPKRLDAWEKQHLKALARLVAMELQGQSAAEELITLKHQVR